MSSNNRLENTTNYQTHSPSPRDGNSPPGLHVPNGNHSLSSKVLTLELSHRPNLSPTHHLQPLSAYLTMSTLPQDHSPIDSPHSLSPPQPQMRHSLHLQVKRSPESSHSFSPYLPHPLTITVSLYHYVTLSFTHIHTLLLYHSNTITFSFVLSLRHHLTTPLPSLPTSSPARPTMTRTTPP